MTKRPPTCPYCQTNLTQCSQEELNQHWPRFDKITKTTTTHYYCQTCDTTPRKKRIEIDLIYEQNRIQNAKTLTQTIEKIKEQPAFTLTKICEIDHSLPEETKITEYRNPTTQYEKYTTTHADHEVEVYANIADRDLTVTLALSDTQDVKFHYFLPYSFSITDVWTPQDEAIYRPLRHKWERIYHRNRKDTKGRKKQYGPRTTRKTSP